VFPDAGQGGIVKGSGGNIIESDYRTVQRHPEACADERSDRAEGGHIIEGHKGRERKFEGEQLLRAFEPPFIAGERIRQSQSKNASSPHSAS